MMHSLHCLNGLRIMVSGMLYNGSASNIDGGINDSTVVLFPPGWHQAHVEHCMDRLRQSIMCQGDLTPSPIYHWEGFGFAVGKAGKHTCRKWEPIRKWMDERGKEGKLLEGHWK